MDLFRSGKFFRREKNLLPKQDKSLRKRKNTKNNKKYWKQTIFQVETKNYPKNGKNTASKQEKSAARFLGLQAQHFPWQHVRIAVHERDSPRPRSKATFSFLQLKTCPKCSRCCRDLHILHGMITKGNVSYLSSLGFIHIPFGGWTVPFEPEMVV